MEDRRNPHRVRMAGALGLEPRTSCSQSRRASHCATPRGADTRTRTENRLLTKQLLCQIELCPRAPRLSGMSSVFPLCPLDGNPLAGRRPQRKPKTHSAGENGRPHPKGLPMGFWRHTPSGFGWGELSRHSSRPPDGTPWTDLNRHLCPDARAALPACSALLSYRGR